MSASPQIVSSREPLSVPAAEKNDLTGRSRLVSNVLFIWGAQMVFMVAGFIMPRMIDRKLGQEVLGVWDFSWSLVTYFRLIDLGITSSVNRYVARYWGKEDIAGINRVVSSATFALLIAASIVLVLTIASVVSLPHFFGQRLNEHVAATQKAVFFLGAMLTIGTALGAFNGVLTGCHRWELQSMRQGVWHVLTVIGMLVALALGGGLTSLALITFVGQTLGQLTVVTLAFQVCRGLRIRRAFVDWKTIRELYIYSGKTLLPSVSAMLLNQTVSLLILGHLGPAALAVFTRPRSLLQQIDSLERKMAMILTPTTSSLQSCGHLQEIRDLLVKAVRYSFYLGLPVAVVFFVFGGQVMQLWMGPAYANNMIPAILALGFLGSCIQTPIAYMLEGLNAHGRPGVAQFLASLAALLLTVLALNYFDAGLVGAAIAVTLPLVVVYFVYLPRIACRRLELPMWNFFSHVILKPLCCVLPFALCLVAVRFLYKSQPILSAILFLAGSATLVAFYWRSVVPERIKNWLRTAPEKWSKFLLRRRKAGLVRTES